NPQADAGSASPQHPLRYGGRRSLTWVVGWVESQGDRARRRNGRSSAEASPPDFLRASPRVPWTRPRATREDRAGPEGWAKIGMLICSVERPAGGPWRWPQFGRGGLRTCLRRAPAYSGKIWDRG